MQAAKRAVADVYASNGGPMTAVTYPDDARMQRIYEASYQGWRCKYHRLESMVDEMYQMYGGERPMRR